MLAFFARSVRSAKTKTALESNFHVIRLLDCYMTVSGEIKCDVEGSCKQGGERQLEKRQISLYDVIRDENAASILSAASSLLIAEKDEKNTFYSPCRVSSPHITVGEQKDDDSDDNGDDDSDEDDGDASPAPPTIPAPRAQKRKTMSSTTDDISDDDKESCKKLKDDASTRMDWRKDGVDEQYDTACHYADPEQRRRSLKKAAHLFMKLARQNHALSQFQIGLCYANGKGVKEKNSTALSWYLKAIASRATPNADIRDSTLWLHGDVQFALSCAFAKEGGTGVQGSEWHIWCKRAAEQGHAKALENLGYFFYDARFGNSADPHDAIEAAACYERAAEKGNASAQVNIGNRYEAGNGVKKDLKRALCWYQRSADQRYPLGYYSLAVFYANGIQVAKNLVAAAQLFRQGANVGDAACQRELGICYQHGYGVAEDAKEAFKLFRLAAESKQRDREAQYCLAQCYMEGEGVDKNMALADYWMAKAAQQGDPDAVHYLKTIC